MANSPVFQRGGGMDPDAVAGIAAVLAAGGSLTGAQQAACNTFIVGLKDNSLWTTFYGLYLLAGGTSGGHAVNWKSPGTYTITWVNSPTHDANGVTGNGTTAHGICADMLGNSVVPHLHGQTAYVRTVDNGASSRCFMGFQNNAGTLYYTTYRDNGGFNSFIFGAVASLTQNAGVGRTGTLSTNRTSTTLVTEYNNGSSFQTNVVADSSTPPSAAFGVLCTNDEASSPQFFTTANISLLGVHSPHDGPKASAFHTLIQALQTAFGRQV